MSSDSNDILETATRSGVSSIKRPDALATDQAPSEPVVEHVLQVLRHESNLEDTIVFLQPTSPLRSARHIKEALDLMKDPEVDSVISAFEPQHTPYKAFCEDSSGFLHGLVDAESPFKRRQDLPRAWMPNGAIYIIKRATFERGGRLIGQKCRPYPMDEQSSVDIDLPSDLKIAERYLCGDAGSAELG